MHIRFCSSVLLVKDIQASRQFYETVFNQEVGLDHGLCIGFKAGFSLWQIDYAYPIIHGRSFDSSEPKGFDQMELYFESETINEVYEALKASGVEFVHEIIEQPWGQKVFRVYDPDRNVVEVGEPMGFVILRLLKTGMTDLEVAQKTAMPLEIVKEVAKGL